MTTTKFLIFIMSIMHPILGGGMKNKFFGTKPETKMDKYRSARKNKPAPRSTMKENATTPAHIRDSIKPIAVVQGSAGLFEIKTTELSKSSKFVLEIYESKNLPPHDKDILKTLQTNLRNEEYHHIFDKVKEELYDINYRNRDHHVNIFGLKSTGKKLNGKAATLKKFDFEKEKWHVHVQTELGEYYIKPENLMRNFSVLSKNSDLFNLYDAMLAIAVKKQKGNDHLKSAFELATGENMDLPLLCNQLFVEQKVEDEDFQKYFIRAVRNNSLKCVKTILAKNDWKTKIQSVFFEQNPLSEIANGSFRYDPTEMCYTLLEKGMKSLIEKKIDDRTPLMEAAKNNKPSLIKCLIKHGAQINASKKHKLNLQI